MRKPAQIASNSGEALLDQPGHHFVQVHGADRRRAVREQALCLVTARLVEDESKNGRRVEDLHSRAASLRLSPRNSSTLRMPGRLYWAPMAWMRRPAARCEYRVSPWLFSARTTGSPTAGPYFSRNSAG